MGGIPAGNWFHSSSQFSIHTGEDRKAMIDPDRLESCLVTAVHLPLSNQRDPHGFKVNHRLEAVDQRNPMLIRVATVTHTEDYRLKVDGLPGSPVSVYRIC